MRVKAIQAGHIGGLYRSPGDEFDVPEGTHLGGWMVPVEAPKEKPPEEKAESPQTTVAAPKPKPTGSKKVI